MSHLKLLGDRILIKVVEESQTTSGGILLPDSAREKSQKAEVVSVGLGRILPNGERESIDIEEGDTILFNNHSGLEIKLEGVDYKILLVRDVLGVVG
jgi:chaperonin GroES